MISWHMILTGNTSGVLHVQPFVISPVCNSGVSFCLFGCLVLVFLNLGFVFLDRILCPLRQPWTVYSRLALNLQCSCFSFLKLLEYTSTPNHILITFITTKPYFLLICIDQLSIFNLKIKIKMPQNPNPLGLNMILPMEKFYIWLYLICNNEN